MSEHREYRREVPGSQTAAVFIHGICGSPNFFQDFYACLPESWTIHSILIEGHGGSTLDFSRSSMAAWKGQVTRVVDELAARHESIVLVGHSMGTLLAIEQGLRLPGKVRGLFLLAVPLKVRARPTAATHSIRTALGLGDKGDPAIQAAKSLYSIEPDRRIWRYLGFIPRYYELLVEMRRIRSRIPELTVPTYVYQSGKDEIVSPASAACLAVNPGILLHTLADSDHKYHLPKDKAFLSEELRSLARMADRQGSKKGA